MKWRFQNFKNELIPIALILIFGTILRFWNFNSIPFTHDEFSALFRTQYSNFSDLIKNGVMPDGHPAGIQVFLYYWVKIVGFSEFWVKLPFALMGVLSIWLIYLIAKEWFSENTALFVASSMAFMQFFIMYSQIARPYISGVFFTLIMVFFWHRTLFKKNYTNNDYLKNSLGFVLGAVLCSYNHYFSLLMVVLVGSLGLLYVNRQNFKWYIGSLLTIMLLYLPHLKIFFYQFGLQGLGWLGKPNLNFFVEFIKYLTHFNGVVLYFFIGIWGYGIWNFIKNKETFTREQLIVLFLGVSPSIIGYLYSTYRAPVLQYSILIFSVPFLFLFFFSFIKKVKKLYLYSISILWSLLLIYSLVFTRNHYHYFYKSIYKETFNTIKQNQLDSTLILCGFSKEIGNYYQKKFKIKDTLNIYYPYLFKNKIELYNLLSNSKYKRVLFSTVTNDMPSLFALCHEYFPHLIMHKFLDQGEIRIMERGSALFTGYTFLSSNAFNERNAWSFNQAKIKKDANDNIFYVIDKEDEFDVQYEFQNKNEINDYAQIIDISAWIFLPDSFNGNAHLVASIEKDSILLWQSFKINSNDLPKMTWIPISTSIFIPDFNYSLDSIKIKTYFWNPERQLFYVSKSFLGIRKGNSYIYWINHSFF